MNIYDREDDVFKTWVCAAYGDVEGVQQAISRGITDHTIVPVILVAAVNKQEEVVRLLQHTPLKGTVTTIPMGITFRLAKHNSQQTQVYLPVSILFSLMELVGFC
jgi:hypothetical protein